MPRQSDADISKYPDKAEIIQGRDDRRSPKIPWVLVESLPLALVEIFEDEDR